MKLVSTLGKTPGGVAETLINLTSGNYVSDYDKLPLSIDELVVVRTRETDESFFFLQAILTCCVSLNVKVREFMLPFDDVNSPRDFVFTREELRKLLKPGDFLDFSGGRKAIGGAAILAAREAGAHLVSTIIDQEEYMRLNQRFNELKGRAFRVYGKGDCLSYFCELVSSRSRTIIFF